MGSVAACTKQLGLIIKFIRRAQKDSRRFAIKTETA